MKKKINMSITNLSAFFIPLLLIIATLAVFWPVYKYGFVNLDDSVNIYENPYLNPVTADNTLHFWLEPYKRLYIPLTYTAWAALGWLSQYMPAAPYGLNPHIFHTANLIFHLFSTLVVFSILRMLLSHGFKDGENADRVPDPLKVEIAAGLGALIFALHPVQVESVAWITGMKDLLCGLFSFLAIREYLAYAVAAKNKNTAVMKNIHYILACAAFLLALLSKPVAVVVPLVALILDRWVIKRSLKESAIALIGWFIVAGLFAIIAKTIQQSEALIVPVPLWTRPFIAGDALAFYLYKLVFPLQLGIDYGRTPDYVLEQWWGYVTWLVPFALVAVVWFSRERKALLVSLGIFAASLLPVLGFITFIFQAYSTVGDRYLYIPMLGAVLAVSWIVFNAKTKFAAPLCVVVILLFGIRSSLHLPVWMDNAALYTNALKTNPYSSLSSNGLGVDLLKQKKVAKAIEYLINAVELRPDNHDALNNLGAALEVAGRLDQAISYYERAIEIQPGNADAHYNLGIALGKKGKWKRAAYHYRKAKQLRPALRR